MNSIKFRVFYLIITFLLTGCNLIRINQYVKNMACTYYQKPSKFNYSNNQILIKTNIGDTLSVNMFLDLGASKSLIFIDSSIQKVITKQKIVPLPMRATAADGTKVQINAACFGTMSTPFLNIANSFILIKDGQNTVPCDKFQGIWGADLFVPGPSNHNRAKVLVISMQDSTLSVLDSLPDVQNWTLVETKFDGLSSVFYIKMKIGSKFVNFLFDTGNSGNIIMNENDFRSANQNLNSISDVKKYYGHIVRTAAGSIYDTVYEYRRSLFITDNLSFDSVPIRLMKSIDKNNVGMEFIKRFNVIVDYQNKNIYLQPNRNYKPEKSSFFTLKGFKPTRTTNEGFVIQALIVDSSAENAGLNIGDEIISINGVQSDSIDPCTIVDVYNKMDGNLTNNEIIIKRGDKILKFVL